MSARRLRVGYLSPLPPAATGIADYSAELLPRLAEHLELEVFTESPAAVSRELLAGLEVRPYRDLPDRAPGLDLVVYQMGNNAPFHGAIYRLLLRYPGVVVLHEFLLHHMIQELTLEAGDLEGYREEMRYCYGRTGERVVQAFLDERLPVDRLAFPLFERAVDASLGMLVHNRTCRQRILASRPEARVEIAPMPFDGAGEEAAESAREAARRELGLEPGDLILGSFGFVTPYKRMEVSLRAFARLRRQVARARFLVVGEVSSHYDLEAVLASGLGEGVELMGRTDLATFHRYMQAVDVALNLRHPSGGETSATLVRLLGLGLPVAVSDQGPFAEVPDGCCLKVPVDWSEEEVLAAMLLRMAEDPPLRRQVGASARRYALEEHAPEKATAAYVGFLEALATRTPEPFVPRPPLVAQPGTDLSLELVRRVSAALADLGIGEGQKDRDLLGGVARSLVELGLDRGQR